MTTKSQASTDNSSDLELSCHGDATPFLSGVVLKASTIAPRDIIDGLPEEILRWLHEGFDREVSVGVGGPRRVSLADFESVIVDRLFPLRDQRGFVVALRRHCFATALAAGAIAELRGGARDLAYVCGWLHEMGTAACIQHIDEAASAVDDDLLARLWPTISRSAAQHGIRLASRWRLPSSIRHAMREHATFANLHPSHPIVAIVVIAEQVAASVGCCFHAPVATPEMVHALSVVGIDPTHLAAVAAKVDRWMRQGGPRPAYTRSLASTG